MILFSIRYSRLYRKINNAERMMSLSDGSAERYIEIEEMIKTLGYDYINLQSLKGKPGRADKRKLLARSISRRLREYSIEVDKVAVQSLLPRYQHRYYRRLQESMS